MAGPAATWCNTPDHANLIATVGEQSRLISQLFAKIQNLENKLEIAQQAIHNAPAHQNPTSQAPNLATPGDGYVNQQDYSPPAPSAHDTRRAQARGQPCNYGSNCTRENCWYEHPGSRSAESSNSSSLASNQSQPTNGSTRRINQECKNGVNCTRKQCWFEHPSEWVPPNRASQGSQPQIQPQPQSQSQSQPQSSTEPPAAEVDSWGTSQDLSSWGATSTNDWSTPADNTWGAPTQADNGWGNTSETSWNTHTSNQHNPPAKNSRSASTTMSREGSVSNSSTNRSQGRGRKARGKGRRADSESIATESTPMSPAALAPTPHVEPIPAQIPLPSPTQSADQASSLSEFGPSDEINTPSLESWGPSSSPEPEAPGTPKASWSDEPNIDVVYFPDPPLDLNESQPSVPEGKSMDLPEDHASAKPSDDPRDLAPSDLYSSWGTTTATASDWGLDPNEFPDPSPTADHTTAGKKSKSKGKQRETFSTSTNGRSTPRGSSLNPAAQSETSLPANEPQESEPVAEPVTPDPPQGVPHEEIPDWLLGADEDAHAALGIPRAVSPKPSGPSAPPRLAPTNPAPRPPLSKLAGENFPSLSSILPTPKPSQSKDATPSGPTFSPRPVGWKITRTSDTSSSSGRGKGSKPKDSSSKK